MESFGSYLRTEREKKGIRLEEIASITKIHLRNLELMEADQWNELPPEPFIRGFITAYTKYVGIDSREALEKYYVDASRPVIADTKLETPIDTPHRLRTQDKPLSPPPGGPMVEAPRHFPAKAVFATLGILAVLGGVVGLIYVGKEHARTQAQSEGIDELTDSKALLDKEPARSAVTNPVAQQPQTPGMTTPPLVLAPPPEVKAPPSDERQIAASTPVAPMPVHPPLLAAQNPEPPPAAVVAVEPPKVVEAPKVAEPAKAAEPERHPVAEKKAPEPVNEVVQKTESAPAPTVAPQPVVGTTGKPHEVVVENKHRTWIKVIIDDAAPTETILAEGQRTVFGAGEKIKITLGNSSGSKVTYNGTEDGGTKFSGTIRYYKFPADAKFPQDKPKKKPKPQPTEAPSPETPGETSAEPPATSVIQ